MALWDRVQFLDQPCACGAGRLTGWCESENYPPFRTRVQAAIACTACAQRYVLVAHAIDDIQLFARADLAAMLTKVHEHIARTNALWERPGVLAVTGPLARDLRAVRTIAGRYRLLLERELIDGSPSTFRRWFADDLRNPDRLARQIAGMNVDQFPQLQTILAAVAAVQAEPVPEPPFVQLGQAAAAAGRGAGAPADEREVQAGAA